jgi:hypothetical protein
MDRATRAGVTGASILRFLAGYCVVLTVVVGLLHSYKPLAAIGSVVGVVVLAVILVILRRVEPGDVGAGPGSPAALRRARAVRVGLICGLLWVLEISVNNLLAPPLPGRDWFDDVIWAVISLVILVSAARASYQGGRLGAGVVFGAWAGLASGLAACATALSLVVFGMTFLTADPLAQQEWAVRGAASMAPTITEYVAFETFAGAFAHLLVVGVAMSTLLGVVGGAIGVVSSWTRRRTTSRRAGPPTR